MCVCAPVCVYFYANIDGVPLEPFRISISCSDKINHYTVTSATHLNYINLKCNFQIYTVCSCSKIMPTVGESSGI